MERTTWPDERIDDAFTQLREEMKDLRAEMRAGFASTRSEFHADLREIRGQIATLKLFMLGGLVTILAAFIALHG